MDPKIDFSTYSLDELHAAAKTIDEDQFPEQVQEIADLIAQREQEHPEEIDTSKEIGKQATKTDRLLAAIIDSIIAVIAMIPLFSYFGMAAFEEPDLQLTAAMFVYGLFITVLIHGYLLSKYAQTVGKHYMSIRVENLDGSRASFNTILFKRILPMQIIGIIPAVGQFIAGLINPLFIFGKQRRCLHDYIAKTKVSYTE